MANLRLRPTLLACSRSVLRLEMGSLPVLKPEKDQSGRFTTVPFHQGRDIAPPLLRQIAKDIGMTVEAFLEHR